MIRIKSLIQAQDNTSGIEGIENINGSSEVHEEYNLSMESESNEQRSDRQIELEKLLQS